MHRLLEESQKIKKQADKILKDSRVIEILGEYGKVNIAGSYALNVMLRPDIDLFVVTENHNWDKLLDIQTKIMQLKYFREFDFINWVDFNDSSLVSIKGYYFQPWVPFDGKLWKIDIWLITPEYDKSIRTTEYFQDLLNNVDESKKIIILQIKEAMKEGNKYKKGVDGKLIYQAA